MTDGIHAGLQTLKASQTDLREIEEIWYDF